VRHNSPEFRKLAEDGTILRCLVGSTIHGISIADQDDRDEMGVCIEPPEYVIGLQQFEQYEHHTAWERPGGRANRSGPGDLDITIYSLRKYMRLALGGNPTILLPLFVPEDKIIDITPAGEELIAMRDRIISRQAGQRFAGYLHAQRRGLLSRDGKGRDITRPELIKAFGWDTKFGGHMVRLGVQGVELLETGRITLPMPEPWRTWVRECRTGGHTMDEALSVTADLEKRLIELCDASPLREYPDREWADRWMIGVYRTAWGEPVA